jgi:type IV pilus assembly protein PilQ
MEEDSMRVPSRASVSSRGILAGVCLILAPVLAAGTTLVGATLTRSDGEAVLALSAEEPIHYDVFQLTDPDRVVIDLLDTQAAVEPSVTGVDGSGWFGGIRQGLWRDEPDGRVVRYVLETTAPSRWGVRAEGNQLRLCVNRADMPAATTAELVPETMVAPSTEVAAEPAPDSPTETAIETTAPTTTETPGAAPAPAPVEPTAEASAAAPAVSNGPSVETPSAEPFAEIPSETPAVSPVETPTTAPAVTPVEPTASASTQPQAVDMAPPLGAADPAVPASVLSQLAERTMNLDVQGADIRTVLRSIAEFGKVNIVPDRDIEGPVSVRLVNVPWRQALAVVCESASLTYMDRDGVIRVATRKIVLDEDIDREAAARKHEELMPLETAILPVDYANAEELRKSVAFALSKRGNAEVDARTNSILITDIAERIEQVRGMVRDLDTETPQVEIVAKLVDVDVTAARQLGISWNIENLHSDAERISGSISHKSPVIGATTEMKVGMIRSFGNIDATIEALETKNKANLLSNPSITTVNNRKARILVGKEVPLIVLDQSGNPITELKKVGITLEVTPYINSDGRVTMDLHPEVSDLSSQSTVQGGIVFTTTEADTRVMVNDGETAVIGGLISQQETRFEQGVPVLRSIPILGHLFRMSDVRKENRELMIFVTPRIVRGSAGRK